MAGLASVEGAHTARPDPGGHDAKLTGTQTLILSAGAQRACHIALPLSKGLAGAAAKMAVGKMIMLGWLKEVDANLRRNEPL